MPRNAARLLSWLSAPFEMVRLYLSFSIVNQYSTNQKAPNRSGLVKFLAQEVHGVISIAVGQAIRPVDMLVGAAFDAKTILVKDREMQMVSPLRSVQEPRGVSSVTFVTQDIPCSYGLSGVDRDS